MARKKDTPCSGCGKMLWTGSNSAPADRRLCRDCLRGERAADQTVAPEPDPQPVLPAWIPPEQGLGERGRRLYREFTAEGPKLGPLERTMLEEACRIADRLDQLDDFLRGREGAWLRFHARNEDGSIVRVVVDRALSESRQQADTLRSIVADLLKKTGTREAEEPAKESILDELARRRTERQQAASGP